MLAHVRSEEIVMLRAAFFSVCSALVLASAANADVYKYTDEKGNVQYTDRPLTLPAERLSISSQRSDVVEIDQRVGEEAKTTAEQDKARQQADKAKAEQKKAAAANTEGKAEACSKARQDYVSRMNAQKLYEEEPNGERRYLTSAELDAARSSAKQAMDTLCN
jgi:membrane protein involved in colicin uptake